MEKTITATPGVTGIPIIWETPHYAIVKTKLPKENTDNPGLACFAVIDKEHGVVWGARSGIGEAKVAACIAEQNWIEGTAASDAAKQRGWTLGGNGGDPSPEPFPSFN